MKESIEYLRELNAKRTREPWKPIGPFGDARRWEMRTPDPDPKSKHEWPTRLFESVGGQIRPQDETDFAFVAALVNNADDLLAAHTRTASLTATLRYLETQAKNGSLHPEVVIQNVRMALRNVSASDIGDLKP